MSEMSDISKILGMLKHQTNAECCVLLVRDARGECHIVSEGNGWMAMVVSAACRVLAMATPATAEKSSVVEQSNQ